MKEALHKVVFHYRADETPPVLHGNSAASIARAYFVGKANLLRALELIRKVREWLEVSDRLHHVLNIYDNTDDDLGRGEVVVVLNDRDTAILLKLAVDA